MSPDAIHEALTALAQAIMRERPWWDVRGSVPSAGPPGAGLLDVRVQLRRSGAYRSLRVWFRHDTPVAQAVALLDQLIPNPHIANSTELYAWECRAEEAPDARPYRRRRTTG